MKRSLQKANIRGVNKVFQPKRRALARKQSDLIVHKMANAFILSFKQHRDVIF